MKKGISGKKYKIIGIAVVLAAAIFVLLTLWQAYREGYLIPPPFPRREKEEVLKGGLTLDLHKGALRILDTGGEEIFASESGWKVQDTLTGDLDGNGEEELLILCWKRGRFGQHRPFWIKKDPGTWSQHIFLYDLTEDRETGAPLVVRKWMASDIGMVVDRWKLMSPGDDGRQFLILEDSEGKSTVWNWSSWGLKIVDSTVTFVSFGDLLIHRPIYEYGLYQKGGNFDFLFTDFLSDIEEADIACLNGETVLVDDIRQVSGYPSFGSPEGVGEAVGKAGFDVVTLANNHVLDKGIRGLQHTAEFYGSRGLTVLGVETEGGQTPPRECIISKNGIRIALCAYTYGTNVRGQDGGVPEEVNILPGYEETLSSGGVIPEEASSSIREQLKKAKEQADLLIIFVHWGTEYDPEPDAAQRAYAKLFAECGADVVVGSHPHVLQSAEVVGDKTVVYYSLGNFRCAQEGEDRQTGGEARFTAAHTCDGIRIVSHELKQIDAYWN